MQSKQTYIAQGEMLAVMFGAFQERELRRNTRALLCVDNVAVL
jgi:hypothetical protein